jgi:short-subunit dehydrogenase
VDTSRAKRETALITGASGGLGYEFARIFAREGYDLVLVARSADKLAAIGSDLEKKHGVSVRVIPMDLSEASAAEVLFDEIGEAGTEIDVLVNNAGFTVFGLFAETDVRRELELLQVNIVALTHLTKLFLPAMLERGRGKILNVSSTAAFQPGPLMAVYYASKAYVLSFSEALAEEMSGRGVTVTALCPGPTETGFQKRGGLEKSRIVAGRQIAKAGPVARAGYRGLMKGERVVIPGAMNRVIAEGMRFMPRRLATRVVLKAQEARED